MTVCDMNLYHPRRQDLLSGTVVLVGAAAVGNRQGQERCARCLDVKVTAC